jgi:hypothetical protein
MERIDSEFLILIAIVGKEKEKKSFLIDPTKRVHAHVIVRNS